MNGREKAKVEKENDLRPVDLKRGFKDGLQLVRIIKVLFIPTGRCQWYYAAAFKPQKPNKSTVGGKAMRRLLLSLAVVSVLAVSTVVLAQGGFKRISEFLVGYNEVPSVSTTGNGQFTARISNDESRIDWELSYSDLEGAVQQSHIHIGNVGVNGGISVFLCTNLGNGPAGTQPCPAPPATISGTIVAADVSPNIPATAQARLQGLNTGEIDELIKAIRAGATYVNIHSTTWPGGEVRSQIDGNSGHQH